ncbi:cation:proton antiporter [Treponema brennaborense]|nr:cation:proton antiporter [Treponema brennaborense]
MITIAESPFGFCKGEYMLVSLALVFLFGSFFGSLLQKLKLPGLLGMLIAGIVLGPSVLNVLDESLLSLSDNLRRIALVVILMRAGLSLNAGDLKKAGRPALLLCFVPAAFEIAGMLIVAPVLLSVSLLDAAILGTVIAAVSPAVIVPKMIKLQEEGYGSANRIPQMLLAGASVDDIFVIVLFTIATDIALGGTASWATLLNVPISVVSGIAAGGATGALLSVFFAKVHVRDTAKVLILLSVSFLLLGAEQAVKAYVPFSALLAVMSCGMALLRFRPPVARRLAVKFSKLWVGAEVVLFVLVGAGLDASYALQAGGAVVALIAAVLVFRMIGVAVCVVGTHLSVRERLFCMIAYIPKATVQAAIGALPLSMGLACGNIVLTVAVVSILITAPLGSFLIDRTYKRLLPHDREN